LISGELNSDTGEWWPGYYDESGNFIGGAWDEAGHQMPKYWHADSGQEFDNPYFNAEGEEEFDYEGDEFFGDENVPVPTAAVTTPAAPA
jgi:hypothetical protein